VHEAVALGFDRGDTAAVALPPEVAGVGFEAVAFEDRVRVAPEHVDAVLEDGDLSLRERKPAAPNEPPRLDLER